MPQHYQSKVVKFDSIDSTLKLAHYVSDALRSIYREGYGYEKAGIVLSDISSSSGIQQNIFENGDLAKHSQLMNVVDDLNRKQGKHTVVGSSGF